MTVTLAAVAAATGGTVECLGGNIFGVLIRNVHVPGELWVPGRPGVDGFSADMILAPDDSPTARYSREWVATLETSDGRIAWGSGPDDDWVPFLLPADISTAVGEALARVTVMACHRCHGATEPGEPCLAWECSACDGSPETGGCADNHSPVMCAPRFTVHD